MRGGASSFVTAAAAGLCPANFIHGVEHLTVGELWKVDIVIAERTEAGRLAETDDQIGFLGELGHGICRGHRKGDNDLSR